MLFSLRASSLQYFDRLMMAARLTHLLEAWEGDMRSVGIESRKSIEDCSMYYAV